ncbi:MAG: phosphate regulon transcriptional regulator PhoB [Alphaproteobacteria bacterium]
MAVASSRLTPRILIVEDEVSLVELLRYNLEKDGFAVDAAYDGEEALLRIAERTPDLVILDWMLPHVSGIEICRQIRRGRTTRRLPVIMLTARGEEDDRIRGLESGADDFVVKPFSPSELVARVRAVLRRTRPAATDEQLESGPVVLDFAGHRVRRDSRAIHLGPTEFRLLRRLMESPGRVFSRESLLSSVWGHDTEVDTRTVDAHIRRLRRALNGPGEADLIRTVRSAGYAFEPGGAASDVPDDAAAGPADKTGAG